MFFRTARRRGAASARWPGGALAAALAACTLAACGAPPAAVTAAPARPRAARSAADTNRLLPGKNCTVASPYAWRVDEQAHLALLPAGDLRVRLPAGWRVVREQPDIIVLLAPAPPHGLRGVFELFVSPRCDQYHSSVVHRRLATRALGHRFPSATIRRAFDRKRQWKSGLGGIGTSIVLRDDLVVDGRPIPMALYYTPVGASETHAVTFAAACPRSGAGADWCEAAYRALFESAGSLAAAGQRPPRS